jgi:hypothetical protein
MKRQKEHTGGDLSRTSYQCGHCGLKAALAVWVGSVRWQSGRSYEPFPFYFFSLRQDWHVRTIYFCIHTRVSRGIALGFCILFFLPVRRLKCCLASTLGILQFIFYSSNFFSLDFEKSYYIERHVPCLRVLTVESEISHLRSSTRTRLPAYDHFAPQMMCSRLYGSLALNVQQEQGSSKPGKQTLTSHLLQQPSKYTYLYQSTSHRRSFDQLILPTIFDQTISQCANQPPATPAVRLVPPIPSLNPPIIRAQHHHPNSFTRDLTIPAGGVTWFGCGSHIPSVLDSVPENQRCGCGPQIERSGKMYPPGGKSLSLWQSAFILLMSEGADAV